MWYILEGDEIVHLGDAACIAEERVIQKYIELDLNPRAMITDITVDYEGSKVTFSVSTVFLRLDHGSRNGGKPVLFETMVFIDTSKATELIIKQIDFIERYEHTQIRYTSLEDARRGHVNLVDQLEKNITENNLGEIETQNIMLSL